jgi:hypothetical protein
MQSQSGQFLIQFLIIGSRRHVLQEQPRQRVSFGLIHYPHHRPEQREHWSVIGAFEFRTIVRREVQRSSVEDAI